MPPSVLTKSLTVRLGQVLPFSLMTEQHFIVLILERTAKIDNQPAISLVFWAEAFDNHVALCQCFN